MIEECECDDVFYRNEDGTCSHKACEGDLSEYRCGNIIEGIPTDTCIGGKEE